MADKIADLKKLKINSIRLIFTVEKFAQCDKIIDMYLDAQKGICTTYFNKIYSRMNTLQEVEENTHKLNEYKNIYGNIIGISKNDLSEYLENMESKMNKKYIDLYAKQSRQSLIVGYQNKLSKLISKIAYWIESKAQ